MTEPHQREDRATRKKRKRRTSSTSHIETELIRSTSSGLPPSYPDAQRRPRGSRMPGAWESSSDGSSSQALRAGTAYSSRSAITVGDADERLSSVDEIQDAPLPRGHRATSVELNEKNISARGREAQIVPPVRAPSVDSGGGFGQSPVLLDDDEAVNADEQSVESPSSLSINRPRMTERHRRHRFSPSPSQSVDLPSSLSINRPRMTERHRRHRFSPSPSQSVDLPSSLPIKRPRITDRHRPDRSSSHTPADDGRRASRRTKPSPGTKSQSTMFPTDELHPPESLSDNNSDTSDGRQTFLNAQKATGFERIRHRWTLAGGAHSDYTCQISGKWWSTLPDSSNRLASRSGPPEGSTTASHIGRIMETTLGEQKGDGERCTRCQRDGWECWVYSAEGKAQIFHPGDTCARCRHKPGKGPCSFSPRMRRKSVADQSLLEVEEEEEEEEEAEE
ncbi:uncharacterized protein MYCGRDRAFT_97547 [Zymoseptoria tritici IPO323]|uniref:Uncharacterized protein n=1 Tax=Zymoseptoria tritici (strain CBS 115943 / IPO323) TaxID=336722 RepID=F9XQK2_ZYMTI|nr:uncharacterized protein MYCGRDRAFT_97547 [Zymoseptoria tritici IPO323]EGP82477.1 hypothetical protein MYCGRDRAFT_97547 [Zymoseptoria tritici IPO323]